MYTARAERGSLSALVFSGQAVCVCGGRGTGTTASRKMDSERKADSANPIRAQSTMLWRFPVTRGSWALNSTKPRFSAAAKADCTASVRTTASASSFPLWLCWQAHRRSIHSSRTAKTASRSR